MYTILRGISNLEDMEVLTKKETEEAAKIEGISRSLGKGPFIAIYKPIDIVDLYYLGFQKADE